MHTFKLATKYLLKKSLKIVKNCQRENLQKIIKLAFFTVFPERKWFYERLPKNKVLTKGMDRKVLFQPLSGNECLVFVSF